jgi:hypothetical protein
MYVCPARIITQVITSLFPGNHELSKYGIKFLTLIPPVPIFSALDRCSVPAGFF